MLTDLFLVEFSRCLMLYSIIGKIRKHVDLWDLRPKP